ncbi:MAG: 50S ribosomal protein L17 [Bacteroidales bacterium]|nr:50S ribosomal protein L17 [Bacteroidales bacterium]
MRHKKKINHLSRKRGHRHAMLSNMASSLIMHKRIKTTTAKAKALRIYLEPLITKSKDDTTHSRRQVFSYLKDKEATNELFREVAVKVADRPGGYTRIIKLGNRLGDNADMCIMELVDYNENLLAEKDSSTRSSRRRRGGKKKTETAETPRTAEIAEDTELAPEETIETASDAERSADAPAEQGEEPSEKEVSAEQPVAEAEASTKADEEKKEEAKVVTEDKAEDKVEDKKNEEASVGDEPPEPSAKKDDTSSEDVDEEADKKKE